MSPTQRKAWYDANPNLVSRFNKISDNPDGGKFSPSSEPKTFNSFDEWLKYNYPSVDQDNTTPEIMDMLRTKYAMEQRNKNPTEPEDSNKPAKKPTEPEDSNKPTTKPTEPVKQPKDTDKPEKKKPEGVPTIPVPPDHTFNKGDKTKDDNKPKAKPKSAKDLNQKAKDLLGTWNNHEHGYQDVGDAYDTWYKSKHNKNVDPTSQEYADGMIDWLNNGAPAPDGYSYVDEDKKNENSSVTQASTFDMPFVFVSFV